MERANVPNTTKKSVINAYIQCALTHCSSWSNAHPPRTGMHHTGTHQQCHQESSRQMVQERRPRKGQSSIPLQKAMSTEYKTDERIVKVVILHYVKPTTKDNSISLIIYYNTKMSQLLIKNKTTTNKTPLQEDHVIYKHTWKIESCGPQRCIRMMWTTLSRRLTCHLQNGTIKKHYNTLHKNTTTRKRF